MQEKVAAYMETLYYLYMSTQALPTEEQCTEVTAVLKALAHPKRLLILCLLCRESCTVGELEERSGASQSAVSQFLARMRAEGLVDSYREGHNVYYEIRDPKIKKLIQSLHRIFC